jgi:ankyrin repeat protein
MRTGSRCRFLTAVALVIALSGATGGSPAAPPLVEAAKKADREALRALVRAGADVNAADGDGSTALLWVSHWDDAESADLLIKAGADVNRANDLGATPLWAASMNGSPAMVERLLAANANPNLALELGETPLMIASRSGNAAVVEMLLEKGAQTEARCCRGQTALMWAAAQKHADVVAVLLKHGADVHARSEVWSNFMGISGATAQGAWFEHGGNTALMFAARVGDLASARHLVAAGADVNETNEWGVSVLTMAVYSNFGTLYVGDQGVGAEGRGWFPVVGQENYEHRYENPGIIDFLLEQGADPNVGAETFTGLHAAIMHRNEGVVERLLAHGANPNLPLGTWTPLRRLTHSDFYFDRSWVGATPIWFAARFGTPKIVRMLVEQGADASFVHRIEPVAGDGGDVRPQPGQTTTPLMAAVGLVSGGDAWLPATDPVTREAEVLEIVKLLVERGVDVNVTDTNGRTALNGAQDSEYQSVVAFLESVGAKAGAPATPAGRRRP